MKTLKFGSAIFMLVLFTTAAAPSKVKWHKFKNAEAKISAAFPSSFESEVSKGETGDTHKFISEKDANNYMISYTIHNVDLVDEAGLQETSLDAFAEQLKGKISNKGIWNMAGKSGLQATVTFDVGGSSAKCDYRVLIKNNIQYQVIVAGVSTTFDNNTASAFLGKVKIK